MPGITVAKLFLIFVVVSLGAFAATRIQVDEYYAHRPLIVGTPAQENAGRVCRVPESDMPGIGAKSCSARRFQPSHGGIIAGPRGKQNDDFLY